MRNVLQTDYTCQYFMKPQEMHDKKKDTDWGLHSIYSGILVTDGNGRKNDED